MLEFADYFDVLKKRKWVLLVWIVVGLIGAGVAFLVLPKVYRSSTLILVESQKVPTDYIKPMAVDTIEERLIAIQQQILSRTLLQRIIEEFHVYDDELKRQPLEDVIDLMRRDIKITMVDDRFHRNIQAFTISYDSDVPALAMQVTNKLAALFIGENLKVREQLVEGTSEFLEGELLRVKERLDRQEAEISQYKQKHIGQLPQQEEAMFRTLDRLTMEMQTQNDMLRMLVERKEIMRDALETSAGTPGGVIHLSPKGRLRQLREQLAQLLSEYKDTYPDVLRVKREIKDLEARVARGPSADDLEEDVVVSGSDMDSQLRTVDAEIKVRRHRAGEVQSQIKSLELRMEQMPIREQELSTLLRDYETTNKRYQSLLANKESAKITEQMEKRQKGEQFRVLDPANLPIRPVKPDPLRVFLAGIMAGLVLGGGTIWWLDFRNLPFRRPEEIESSLGLPMLASIPHMFMVGGQDRSNGRNGTPAVTGWRQWLDRMKLLPGNAEDGNGALMHKLPTGGKSQRVLQAHMNALGAEQFRVLAGRIVQVREKKGAKILAVTSSLAGEGKTTVALGLAITLARDYLEETILIDGDVRNPEVSTRMGLQDERGLINVLAGECLLNEALYQHTHPNLRILSAGTVENGSRGLTATRVGMQELLADLRGRGVIVILDAPPILPMADMNLFSEVVDGIVLVVRAEQTPQGVVAEALRFLSGGSIEGVVLNDLVTPRHQYYGRYAIAEPPPVL
ncbi:MAG: AAA family ATPase [Nitrospirales bacterium]|nr:AAA family ATPase [Nitrospirales bacterium]